MSYPAQEPRTASAVTRQFFEIVDNLNLQQKQLGWKLQTHANTLYNWRTGRTSATLITMEIALAELGLQLAIVPIPPEPMEQAA